MCFVSDSIANCGPTYNNIVMTYVLLNATFLANPDFVLNLSHNGRHWKVSTDVALTGGGGGGPMSPVDFKKWQCRMCLSLIYAHVTCRI